MKRLFVSVPMRGIALEEIEAQIAEAKERVEKKMGEVKVIHSFVNTDMIQSMPLQALANSLSIMAMCDCVYFCEGWQEARGCKIEHDCAVAYGLDIVGD
jgi:hypothetical protein